MISLPPNTSVSPHVDGMDYKTNTALLISVTDNNVIVVSSHTTQKKSAHDQNYRDLLQDLFFPLVSRKEQYDTKTPKHKHTHPNTQNYDIIQLPPQAHPPSIFPLRSTALCARREWCRSSSSGPEETHPPCTPSISTSSWSRPRRDETQQKRRLHQYIHTIQKSTVTATRLIARAKKKQKDFVFYFD